MAGITAEVRLPSNGLVADKVTIRSMLGKDERVLAEVNSSNFERKIASMLSGLVKGVDVMELTEKDELMLLLWVAVNTYSPSYPVAGTCQYCLQGLKLEADLSAFDIEYLPAGFKDPVPVKLSDGSVVKVRLSRVKDAIAVADYSKSHKDTAWCFQHAVTIDNDKSVIDNMRWIEELSAKDCALIRAVQVTHDHGVKMEAPYTCPRCGESGMLPVPFRFAMVFPTGAELSRLS